MKCLGQVKKLKVFRFLAYLTARHLTAGHLTARHLTARHLTARHLTAGTFGGQMYQRSNVPAVKCPGGQGNVPKAPNAKPIFPKKTFLFLELHQNM